MEQIQKKKYVFNVNIPIKLILIKQTCLIIEMLDVWSYPNKIVETRKYLNGGDIGQIMTRLLNVFDFKVK